MYAETFTYITCKKHKSSTGTGWVRFLFLGKTERNNRKIFSLCVFIEKSCEKNRLAFCSHSVLAFYQTSNRISFYSKKCPTVEIKCRRDDGCECSHNTTRKKTWKKFQALNGIRTHDLCVTGAMLSQLSYQSHMRAVVCGLALYVQWT